MHRDRPFRALLLASLLGACGARTSPSTVTEAPLESTSEGGSADEVADTTPPEAQATPIVEIVDDPLSLDVLRGTLSTDDGAGVSGPTMPTLAAALAACPHPLEDDCSLVSTAAWSPTERRWIVLAVDAGEGGPERVQLLGATPTTEVVLAEHELDRAGVAVLRRALRPYTAALPAENLVREAAWTEYSSSLYVPLVALGAPLEGWLLHLSTNEDLEHPEHVLALVRRADLRVVELARRPAVLAPCDGDGWTCEANEGGDCTEAQLRAEGRLCVEPRGISTVSLSEDRSSLVVLGTRIIAGDGGYPAHHWVAPIALPVPE